MQYRPLGSTALTVSSIGFGAWGIGGHTNGGRSYGLTDDAVSLSALAAAFDSGITFYDTAPLYGLGHSETLIGRAFAGRRDRVVIATKAGYADFTSPQDFTPTALYRSLEASLRRLRTDYVDILQLHDLSPETLTRQPEIIDTLSRLVADGKVRVCGVSAKSPEHAMALASQPIFKVFQVNFNLLDLRALDCGLFERAASDGLGLIARTPLCFGYLGGNLTGEEEFPPEDHRSRWPLARRRTWAERARRMQAVAKGEDNGNGAAALALRFVLSFPTVSTTIPGMLTPAEVGDNAAAGGLPPFSDAMVAALVDCHRNFEGEA